MEFAPPASNTHEHVKLQGHTSSMVQNEAQGKVEVGRISILNEAMVGGKKKKEWFDIKNPSSFRNSEQNKRTKRE